MTPEEHQKLDRISDQVSRLMGALQGNGGGSGGISGVVQENARGIQAMGKQMEHMQTKEGCIQAQEHCRGIRKDEIKQALREELSAKGRSKWLVIKDILIAVLSSSVIAALLVRVINK